MNRWRILLLCVLMPLAASAASKSIIVTWINNSQYPLFFDKVKIAATKVQANDPKPLCYNKANFVLKAGDQSVIKYRMTGNIGIDFEKSLGVRYQLKQMPSSEIDCKNKKGDQQINFRVEPKQKGGSSGAMTVNIVTVKSSSKLSMNCKRTDKGGIEVEKTCTITDKTS